ncbi:hypothetical protein EJ08DRAFT_654505 [Tothia fuscella]|uniref:Uncharacterized protein n=1 Tax=Tothia fuscella TaxID=1048955 RepID=A0A9P4NEI2_9PEZI|nr:hypothetical protein EJ08DRAFT_654505 [Tothia fuscella]
MSRIDDSGAISAPSSIKILNSLIKTTFPPLKKGSGSGNTNPTIFKALQLNLCNSGFAGCYEGGKSIGEGGSAIRTLGPNVVTVNEICLGDVTKYLQPDLAAAWPNDYTFFAFQPAIDRRTNGAYKCKNGDQYGDVVIGRVGAAKWKVFTAHGGQYANQDSGNEIRTFACAGATGDYSVCTTHLSSKDANIAFAQCKALNFDAVPYFNSLDGNAGHTIIGGDLNLKYDTSSAVNVQKCVPNGYTRKGDGGVQHITFSNDFKFKSSSKISVLYTDHPGWLVEMTRA